MDLGAALSDFNQAGIDFLKIELSLANTFMDLSEITRSAQHCFTSRADALKAYRTVLQFLPRLRLLTDQKLYFDVHLMALRKRMVLAGMEL